MNIVGSGATVTGTSAADIIVGTDTLSGKGFTTLEGGGGDDYVYAQVDTITDFTAGQDRVELAHAIFTGLTAGALPASAFYQGSAAHDADDRIIYNAANGALMFDVDGTGSAAAVRFAILTPGLKLSASSFTVV